MTRSSVTLFGVLLFAAGCSEGDRPPLPPVDCSALDQYDFSNISDFSGTEANWFYYADPTPGGIPDPKAESTNVLTTAHEPPGRCNDSRYMRLQAEGHNFWGAGFGDWQHNDMINRAPPGSGYEGISFWARSERYAEKTFLFGIDDSQTMINSPAVLECTPMGDAGVPAECMDPVVIDCMAHQPSLPKAAAGDQDLNGDGCTGPGDIVFQTRCRLPPSSAIGTALCYNGAVDSPPSGGTRVPESDECGNQFHKWIETTETWQIYFMPWNEIVQWPCPNRLEGGIDRDDIRKIEIKLKQGMTYDLWIDDIKFYRRK